MNPREGVAGVEVENITVEEVEELVFGAGDKIVETGVVIEARLVPATDNPVSATDPWTANGFEDPSSSVFEDAEVTILVGLMGSNGKRSLEGLLCDVDDSHVVV